MTLAASQVLAHMDKHGDIRLTGNGFVLLFVILLVLGGLAGLAVAAAASR